MEFVGVSLRVAMPFFLLLIMNSISNAQVVITTQPMNDTVCLTQSTTASFTCMVDRGGVAIFTAGWHILDGGIFVPVTSRPRHMTDDSVNGDIITDTLTVTNVSVDDNDALYRCEPRGGVPSMNVTITVLDPPAVTITDVTNRCTNDFTVSWTAASDEEGLSYPIVLILDGMIVVPGMDTSHNFTDLMPDIAYNISVASRFNTCIGIHNSMLITTLAVEEGVPQRVSNIRTTRITNTTIAIMWDPAVSPSGCGSVFYYIVTIMNSSYMNTTETWRLKAGFSDLINGTDYNISIGAVNRAGTGPTSMITVTTSTGNEGSPNPSNDDGGNNAGAIIGGTIGGILFLIVVSASVTITVIWWRSNRNQNGEKLTSSQSLESPPVQKPNKEKTTQEPVHDAPQYADLQHGASGAPPSVDHSKVAYSQVKEHEPLNYAEVTHEPGADEKPIQGAPRVEYKEVWHQ